MNCPVCASSKTSEWKKDGPYNFLRCDNCGLIFISKIGYPENPEEQYKSDATSFSEYHLITAPNDRKNFIKTLKELERYQKPKTILDVGANVGTFLLAAKERGWRGIGIEPTPKAVSIARKDGGEIIEGFFDENFPEKLSKAYPGIEIDAVHMGDVIEHLFDPLVLLRTAKRVLSKNGYLVIVTPDIDSFLARKYQIKPKEHLVYFNKKSLRLALERSGFEVLSIHGQARIRDIGNAAKGTVKLSTTELVIASIARLPLIGKILNNSLRLFKDELFVLARVKN
ncbi:MAG: hypothetical protein G01um10143_179 [Parcubacteria group bacterium Gr01-1014_3]|nr:MAG: hypothetical protein G01um10143_179 [Parcubacteria group bacterium Gr01-1014_3]